MPSASQLDVGRLQVAMDDLLIVRGLERVGDLPRDRQGLVERQTGGRDVRSRDQVSEGRPVDVFENQRAGFFEPVNRRDVRMVQRREHLRLSREARHPLGVERELRGQHLDRDIASESACRGRDSTSPIPPAPISEVISYAPRRVPSCKAMTRTAPIVDWGVLAGSW